MRKLTTPLRALAALTIAAFALTGCMKVDMNLTINADDTVDGTAIIAIDKRLAGLIGKSEDELIAEMTKETDLPKDAKQEKYSEGDFVGAKITFKKTKLAEFKGEGSDDLSIVHKDGKYTFSGDMDLSEVKLDDPSAKAFADSFQMKIAITFPGKVLEHNGKLDGKTVTWSPKPGESTKLRAVAEEASSFPWTLVIVLIGVLLLLVVAAVVVVVLLAAKKKAAAVAAADEQAALPAGGEEYATTDPTVVDGPDPAEPTAVQPSNDPTVAQPPAGS